MIRIFVIDHRDADAQRPGEIISPYMIYGFERPGSEYADFCALYEVWLGYTQLGTPPEIIGFFGYRKYLAPIPFDHGEDWIKPAHAPDWYQCSKEDFDEYRQMMAEFDGSDIKRLLAQYDILQAPPFPVDNLFNDFTRSRSRHDSHLLWDAACAYFANVHPANKIYPYLFITRWSVFDRMMREMEPLRLELHGHTVGADSTNEEYIKRPMAYVMERVYSLWLENSGLSIREVPLLHCWEMS